MNVPPLVFVFVSRTPKKPYNKECDQFFDMTLFLPFSGSLPVFGAGTLDGFVSSEPRQTTLNSAYKKELLVDVKRRVGRFIYSAALSFNVVNDPYWLPMVEGISEYGKGFKPPSMHELRTWILKAEVDDINIIYEEHEKVWKTYGCSIMSDGWTDGWEKIIETRKRIWWTPCAAHCIDLMLEDIAKLKIFTDTINHAKKVVKFIYGHGTILSLMRKYTSKEILRLAVTRFATSFLTLQNMYMVKRPLEQMSASKDWPIWNKIDARWTPQLHHPLHAAGYYLNPQLRYEERFSNCNEVRDGLYACMDKMLTFDARLKADIQLDIYNKAAGEFGSTMAIKTRMLRTPGKIL
ncbi:uncharacterized protein [Henckelia pumila]|uniref:uncharacterized protein n=1 Tax=Henckelia pumila TaxID=405737 RepID=UPI003C6E4A8D